MSASAPSSPVPFQFSVPLPPSSSFCVHVLMPTVLKVCAVVFVLFALCSFEAVYLGAATLSLLLALLAERVALVGPEAGVLVLPDPPPFSLLSPPHPSHPLSPLAHTVEVLAPPVATSAAASATPPSPPPPAQARHPESVLRHSRRWSMGPTQPDSPATAREKAAPPQPLSRSSRKSIAPGGRRQSMAPARTNRRASILPQQAQVGEPPAVETELPLIPGSSPSYVDSD